VCVCVCMCLCMCSHCALLLNKLDVPADHLLMAIQHQEYPCHIEEGPTVRVDSFPNLFFAMVCAIFKIVEWSLPGRTFSFTTNESVGVIPPAYIDLENCWRDTTDLCHEYRLRELENCRGRAILCYYRLYASHSNLLGPVLLLVQLHFLFCMFVIRVHVYWMWVGF